MWFSAKTVWKSLLLLGALGASPQIFAKVWTVPASANLEFDAQEALLLAQPGDVVELPAGRFQMQGELTITTPHLTLRGQGMEKTILVYGEQASGPQAIYSSADHTTVSDLAIIDHPGDGVKIIGADGPIMRRLRVEWTKHGEVDNGAYGLYPVQCSNVLVEENVVIGASDAGVYVGQSHNIIVRNNRAEYNVAGVEIENSQNADVYANTVTNNTGGVLIFNLPNLLVQGGRGTRVFNNAIYKNNFKNFAPPGNSVATVPQGTGILVLGNDDIEIFENTIEEHNTTSIAVVSYHITEREIDDPSYDATPENIYIHDNILRKTGQSPLKGGNQLGIVAAALSLPYKIPHITYDGIGQPDGKGGVLEAKLEGDRRICIGPNDQDGGDKSYFGNLNLWTKKWWSPIPGSMSRDLAPHDCVLPRLAAITLPEVTVPAPVEPEYTAEEIDSLCSASGEGVNWAAMVVDCPTLADYRLFQNPLDPLVGPSEGGYPYDLTTPLFSDYASKDRVLFIPPGEQAVYRKDTVLDLPLGSVIAKTFYFPAKATEPKGLKKLVETRLLIRGEKGWRGLVYLWDQSGTRLIRGGAQVKVGWMDEKNQLKNNNYRVPNLAQCAGCHLNTEPIGPKPGYLNREGYGALAGVNQLSHLADAGVLRDLPAAQDIPHIPAWNDPRSGTLDARARAYLDINCAHCHSVVGKASTSGLFLNYDHPLNINAGLCKPPIAAGRGAGGTLFDIVPGKPEESIPIGRMNSTKAAIKMPELAKGMVHQEGVDLISEWIRSLPGECKE